VGRHRLGLNWITLLFLKLLSTRKTNMQRIPSSVLLVALCLLAGCQVSLASPTGMCENLGHCVSCKVSTVCDQCVGGFYFVAGAKECTACGDGCDQCSSATTCDKCKANGALTLGPKLGTNRCEPCTGNCAQCMVSGSNRCDECAPGNGPLGTSCGGCAANCVSCKISGAGRCDACKANYILNAYNSHYGDIPTPWCMSTCSTLLNCISCYNDPYTCDVCASGYYFIKGAAGCIRCGKNCTQCASSTACQYCSMDTPRLGPIAKTNSCGPCIDNCATCYKNGPGTCELCLGGYGFKGNSCQPCAQNCSACNDSGAGKCDICSTGYTLNPAATQAGDSPNAWCVRKNNV